MRVPVSRNRKRRCVSGSRLADTPCGYCFSRWATGYDHILPWSAGGLDLMPNLYPCCRRCNSILGSQIFKTLEEKREYVRTWLIQHGKWDTAEVSSVPEPIYQEAPPDLLQRQVSVECLAPTKNTGPTPKGFIVCPGCDERFRPSTHRQFFCSVHCRHETQKQRRRKP